MVWHLFRNRLCLLFKNQREVSETLLERSFVCILPRKTCNGERHIICLGSYEYGFMYYKSRTFSGLSIFLLTFDIRLRNETSFFFALTTSSWD